MYLSSSTHLHLKSWNQCVVGMNVWDKAFESEQNILYNSFSSCYSSSFVLAAGTWPRLISKLVIFFMFTLWKFRKVDLDQYAAQKQIFYRWKSGKIIKKSFLTQISFIIMISQTVEMEIYSEHNKLDNGLIKRKWGKMLQRKVFEGFAQKWLPEERC